MKSMADFFNALADRWDELCFHDPEKLNYILKQANLRPNIHVLDVGCGTGVLESYLLPYSPSRIVGVDISSGMIEKAREKYATPIVDFRCMNILDLHDELFDCIIVYSAFPHFSEPEVLITHLISLLHPHGRLVICHSEGRAKINSHHDKQAGKISNFLPSAIWISSRMKKHCTIEHLEDNDELYLIIGTRKARARERNL